MNEDDWDFRCCCGTHVRRATTIICFFGIFANVVFGVACVYFGFRGLFFIPLFAISIFSHALLLVGNRKKIELLYWPYLFGNILLIAVSLIAGLMGCLAGATLLSEVITYTDKSMEPFYILISGCVLMISVYLQLFFTHVVYLDYKYLKTCLLNPDSKLPRVT